MDRKKPISVEKIEDPKTGEKNEKVEKEGLPKGEKEEEDKAQHREEQEEVAEHLFRPPGPAY
jgi:hypothetical protein